MHDAELVGVGDRLRHVMRDVERLVERQRTYAIDAIGERLALDELHHEEIETVLVADVVQHADVGVVEPRDGDGLALEALAEALVFGQPGRNHLDGDHAVEAGVAAAIDLAHAADAEERQDFVGAEAGASVQRQETVGSAGRSDAPPPANLVIWPL